MPTIEKKILDKNKKQDRNITSKIYAILCIHRFKISLMLMIFLITIILNIEEIKRSYSMLTKMEILFQSNIINLSKNLSKIK